MKLFVKLNLQSKPFSLTFHFHLRLAFCISPVLLKFIFDKKSISGKISVHGLLVHSLCDFSWLLRNIDSSTQVQYEQLWREGYYYRRKTKFGAT